MLPRVRMLLVPLSLLLCSACGTSKPPELLTKIQVEKVQIPAPLLSCPDDPDIPDPLNDQNLAGYILDLWSRGDSCSANLSEIKALSSE